MSKTPLKATTALAFLLCLILSLYSVARASVHEFAQKNIEQWLPEHKDIGLVLGVIHKGESQVFNFGQASFDRDTLFEIGSITKVFTALAFEMSLIKHHLISKSASIGLGRHFKKRNNRHFVRHNGATGGYAAFAAFNRKYQTAVVILCNAA